MLYTYSYNIPFSSQLLNSLCLSIALLRETEELHNSEALYCLSLIKGFMERCTRTKSNRLTNKTTTKCIFKAIFPISLLNKSIHDSLWS